MRKLLRSPIVDPFSYLPSVGVEADLSQQRGEPRVAAEPVPPRIDLQIADLRIAALDRDGQPSKSEVELSERHVQRGDVRRRTPRRRLAAAQEFGERRVGFGA